jgi:hypothetical protein
MLIHRLFINLYLKKNSILDILSNMIMWNSYVIAICDDIHIVFAMWNEEKCAWKEKLLSFEFVINFSQS